MAPMTGQAQAALIHLYERAQRATDSFTQERIDRALDEIVRVNSTDPPAWQVRSAMANASKVITARYETISRWSVEAKEIDVPVSGSREDAINLRLWLHETARLTEGQRELVTQLADGHDAESIAALCHVSVLRAREQISRVRRNARTAYYLDAKLSEAIKAS
jgi:DNA-binding CsgD family transcriptional regulator